MNRIKTKTVPGNSITYKYDLLGRQINIIDTSGTIQNEFDNAGRLKKVTYDYPSLDDKIVQYEYDAAGNRIELTYPDDGKYIKYHYDSLNRLVSICSDDIIGYWNFDEGEGDIAHDVVSGNHGTIYGSLWTTGKVGGALEFDGNNDYVDAGDIDGIDGAAELTVSAWIKLNDATSLDKDHDVASKGQHTSNQPLLFWRDDAVTGGSQNDNFNAMSVLVYDGDTQAWTSSSTDSLNDNLWHHVAFTFKANTADGLKVYVDGSYQNSASTVGVDSIDSTQNTFKLGRADGAPSTLAMDGCIDEVMIFDRALLEEEIEAIYGGQDVMIASYAYDALSSRVSARYGNGTTAEYYYDMADRLLGLDNQIGSENLSYDYSYNNVGNRLTMLVNGTDLHSYTYDNIYQLTEVDYPEDSFTDDTSFIYDPAGNRWQVTGGGLGPYYATNSLNQYTSAGTVYFSYDDNGNLTGDGCFPSAEVAQDKGFG